MDESNPYAAPKATDEKLPPGPRAPRSLRREVRHGATAGFKWSTYIFGPLAGLMLVVSIADLVIESAIRKRPPSLNPGGSAPPWYAAFVFYLIMCGGFSLIGAVIGAAGHLARRAGQAVAKRGQDGGAKHSG